MATYRHCDSEFSGRSHYFHTAQSRRRGEGRFLKVGIRCSRTGRIQFDDGRNQMNANLIYVMQQIASLISWQVLKTLRRRERSLAENSLKYLQKKPESLTVLNSWHRVQSGRIFLSQKKASRHIIMRAAFRKIWTLNLLSLSEFCLRTKYVL